MYPAYGMRQMADNDMLFDVSRAGEVRAIMENMGFTCEHFGTGAHDIYHKKPVLNFELHRLLFNAACGTKLHEYYRDVERLLVPDGDGSCGMHFPDEELYVYLVAHEWKHYSAGGTGLRSLMDTYVWLRAKKDSMDWDLVRAILDELGLAAFEERNRRLAIRLFAGGTLDAEDEGMLAYIIESGTHGTFEHRMDNEVRRRGRLGSLVHQLFLPLDTMREDFPILDCAPFLLPACWLARYVIVLVERPSNATSYIGALLRHPGKRDEA
jgi:hypothetical protein